ncbi:SPOR domain-containing protein [Alphaproteobacteria bacterium]|nr:SPOR domain-containing protein [Alphaproteobacteria bacterium]
MEQDEDLGGLNWRAISIFGVLIVVGAAAVVWLTPQLMSPNEGDLIIIEAPKGAFKTKPDDPGGTDIAHQDSSVMVMLGGLEPGKSEVETLIPPSDSPELPTVTIGQEAEVKTDEVAQQASGNNTQIAETTVPAPPPVEKAPEQVVTNGSKTIVAKPMDANTDKDEKEAAIATPVSKPVPDAPGASASLKKKKIVVDGDEPAYMVQLAAFRNPDIAAEQAGLLATKHQKRLSGVTMGTMRIDTGNNGVFWRIVSEPLPRAAADKVCASLKRAGQDCILRKFISPSQ